MAIEWMKQKYRCHKPVKQNKAGGGHSGNNKKKKAGVKSYKYGSRVMIVDAGKGKRRMVAGDGY